MMTGLLSQPVILSAAQDRLRKGPVTPGEGKGASRQKPQQHPASSHRQSLIPGEILRCAQNDRLGNIYIPCDFYTKGHSRGQCTASGR